MSRRQWRASFETLSTPSHVRQACIRRAGTKLALNFYTVRGMLALARCAGLDRLNECLPLIDRRVGQRLVLGQSRARSIARVSLQRVARFTQNWTTVHLPNSQIYCRHLQRGSVCDGTALCSGSISRQTAQPSLVRMAPFALTFETDVCMQHVRMCEK